MLKGLITLGIGWSWAAVASVWVSCLQGFYARVSVRLRLSIFVTEVSVFIVIVVT